MKKYLCFFPLLFICLTSFGQDEMEYSTAPGSGIDIRKVRFGVYIAPNISWMRPTASKSDEGTYRVKSNSSRIGYTWGLLVDYFFAENYGIGTGFQVNTTGGSIEATRLEKDLRPSTVYNADFKYYLQYLEVPFQLKLRSDELSIPGMKVFGQIGITAGANIGKKATYTVTYTDKNLAEKVVSEEKEKLSGSFTIAPFMFQLNIGAGVEKALSDKMSAYFGIFFNNGFLPDATNPADYELGYEGSFGDGNVRLNSFAFRFGLFF